MQNLNCINNLKNKDRYKNFIYFNKPMPFNETPVFSDKYKVIQLHDINVINGTMVGFCGVCKVKNGDVIPLDDDSYYKEMQTVGYEEFTDKEGNLCLDLLVNSW